jgi:hypothetical protein
MPLDNIPSKLFNVITHIIAIGLEFDDDLTEDEPLEKLRTQLLGESSSVLCTSHLLKIYDVTESYDQIFIVS